MDITIVSVFIGLMRHKCVGRKVSEIMKPGVCCKSTAPTKPLMQGSNMTLKRLLKVRCLIDGGLKRVDNLYLRLVVPLYTRD
jgi:hypothetical protein